MLLEKGLEKISKRYVVGYDLGKEVSQISFQALNQDAPETLSVVTGEQQFNIPTVLCKREEVNQWYYGKDALKHVEEGDGNLIDDLWDKALSGKPVVIEGREYNPESLLTLFVKKSFSLFGMVGSIDKVDCMVFTVQELSERAVAVLEHIVEGINLKNCRVFFQSHMESIYYYMLNQEKELWKGQAVVLDLQGEHMVSYTMDCNRRTTPVAVFIQKEEFPDLKRPIWPEETPDRYQENEFDKEFLNSISDFMVEKNMTQIVTSVHLIGEGFRMEYLEQSMRYLCRGRRVFKGNNLYSKGAVYSGMERLLPSEEGKKHVFLGREKLKSNIGIKMIRDGEESYMALLNAGSNWYDVEKEVWCYLDNGNSFYLTITPLINMSQNGDKIPVVREEIVLDGLPERPYRSTRLRIRTWLTDVDKVRVEVEDYGLGDIFPGTHQVWEDIFKLSEVN